LNICNLIRLTNECHNLHNAIRDQLLQTSSSHVVLVQNAVGIPLYLQYTVTSRQMYTRVRVRVRLLRIYTAHAARATISRRQSPARHFSWMKPTTWTGKKEGKKRKRRCRNVVREDARVSGYYYRDDVSQSRGHRPSRISRRTISSSCARTPFRTTLPNALFERRRYAFVERSCELSECLWLPRRHARNDLKGD